MIQQQNKSTLLFVLLLVSLAFRLIPAFSPAIELDFTHESPLYKALFGFTASHKGSSLLVSALIMLLTAMLSYGVLNHLWLFESRSMVPPVLLALLMSSGGVFQYMSSSLFFPLVLLFAFNALFASQDDGITPLRSFNLSLILATGGLLNFYILLLLPAFIGIQVYTRNAGLKTILAMLAGLGTVAWILIAVLLLSEQMDLLPYFLKPVAFTLINLKTIPDGYYAYILLLTILALVAFIRFRAEYAKMKQDTRMVYLSSNILAIYILLLALAGVMHTLMALTAALVSFTLLFSFYLIHARKRVVWVFFSALVLFMLISFIQKF